jgi:hypothetical protein
MYLQFIWIFAAWSQILIPLFTVGIHKRGIHYDEINANGSRQPRSPC